MPRHFANLTGAATLPTSGLRLTARVVADLIANQATGVIHGVAGTGKTYAVEAALEHLASAAPAPGPAPEPYRRPVPVATFTLAFPSRPTMRLVADELLTTLTGTAAPTSRNRFYLTNALIELLAGLPRLLVIDEAQRLTGDCIELLRHLHDHPDTRFALLYVGGDGCWEVLSREPMLRSRVFRRLPFHPLRRGQIPALIRDYHPIYASASDALLLEIDDAYAHGTLRDWAVFTRTAVDLCREDATGHITERVAHNAYALLGGADT
ncbi:ATP-binding protein [Bailinhaonella thermotolerans]|uniref:ATP-binding protein n=1 Tax=Bailinhaonella thermotolerans TaxID=1070861 RepID=A0A3A4A849_9ACTN|nr:ATP-binding protein [Bailinhaonella thermotolerans]RJL23167.1 ATP-binding protein [Bailinhaonella thermotolerans]